MKIEIPDSAAAVLHRLWECGYEAFAVGGCVRDALLGTEPNDWDVTTSAKPDRIIEIFSDLPDFAVIPTGIAHGTITVLSNGRSIEITTYRIDGEYADHRRPDQVAFTDSLTADLARRDFTINAMAYAPSQGLCDPFGGAQDLRARRIRCVGDPHRRFSEDALRILRAIRFSAVLGFTVERASAQAAIELRELLGYVSRERISAELAKLLCGKACASVIDEFREVVQTILPATRTSDWDILIQSLGKLQGESLPLMLAALLADCEDVREVLGELRFDKKTCARAQTIVSHCRDELSDKLSIKRLCRDIGIEAARDTIILGSARGDISEDALTMHSEIRENHECVSLSMLKIDGNMLKMSGFPPKEIGRMLERLLDGVMRGDIINEPEALLGAARAINERK